MRLIDADALERSFRDVMEPDVPTYLNVITGMIKAMPTVDAKPVKTAQLIRETDRERHWHCSRCGKVFGLTGLMYKYCHECGAKIDKG